MIDISQLTSETVVGGIAGLLASIYAVWQKLSQNKVDVANQKAEVNIIETITKQRDDAISMYEKYRNLYLQIETEHQKLKAKLDDIETDSLDYLKRIDTLNDEIEALKDIIKYMSDSIELIDISHNDANNKQENICNHTHNDEDDDKIF